MNMRNADIITARPVPDKTVSDDFLHAVISNCTTRIQIPAPKKLSPELLPCHFNMAAAGVMKKGMSMNMFSSPGNTVFIGQPGAGKTKPPVELIPDVTGIYKKGEES
ncbi:conjugal transfer protein TrbD [Salmonella enterica]|nr:conjugal transfer protein TrbD [Salmonella enterica]EJY0730841.1 conjugal transfer protein TrbD [Salmonella enterica]